MNPVMDKLADKGFVHTADLPPVPVLPSRPRLAGKRAGMVVFSSYPADPRPRRAAEALLKEGMSIDLICEGGDHLPCRETLDKLQIIRIPIRHYRGSALSYAYQYFTFIVVSAAILAWRMLRGRYDLVYVHNMPDILVVSALLPKAFGAKVILDQHDPMPELMKTIFDMDEKSMAVRIIRRLEKWSIARANLVITVNKACKRLFSERSCHADKIGIVMNSPDGVIFPYRAACSYPERDAGRKFRIMYHGSLVERNGLELAVDALARVLKENLEVELYVYGHSTPYLEHVMEKVRAEGLEGCVYYLGPRKLEQLAQEIEACDIGIIPNRRNTFTDINTPTRIFEYLALGKPVIAPRTPGIEDYFGPESLLFFEAGNADDLAKTIEHAVSHSAEMVASAERGQRIYLAHTWQQERETLVRLVADLVGAGAVS